MSDLFHETVPDAFIDRVFAVMALAPQHTFQVLTKRAERMRDYVSNREQARRFGAISASADYGAGDVHRKTVTWPLPNVWLGPSIENQTMADKRFPIACALGEAGWHVMVSMEPLLGAVTIPDRFLALGRRAWVIPGGESGTDARPCEVAWVRSIVKQCKSAGVAVFVKQLGAVPLVPAGRLQHWEWRGIKAPEDKRFTTHADDVWRVHLANRKGGDPEEWPANVRVREYPPALDAEDWRTRG